MTAVGSDLYVDFGTLGLYRHNGAWTLISSANAEGMTAVGSDLYVHFGGMGLYKYNVAWRKISKSNPENLWQSKVYPEY
jgi:hypothetical protein